LYILIKGAVTASLCRPQLRYLGLTRDTSVLQGHTDVIICIYNT